ncbi:cystathionine gamma-synthase [Ephemerocybe angulata]|uniref:Cystathionine gamma-synthase n=1 Tax=Ephemerocybe angulata TaxID=980116 RepID=A0A8H6IH80_9AGAR|nr:cystathionine gamma-synthase [Tulosesus angulatus]
MSKLQGNSAALGTSIPPDTPHAISVSLPTWRDNVGYEEGDKRVVSSMVNGYPRFFIHLSIAKLAGICEQRHAVGNERAMLFPTKRSAQQCREFIGNRSKSLGKPVTARLVHLLICPDDQVVDKDSIAGTCADLHIVLFPGDSFSVAKEFWQHAGLGISSRLQEEQKAKAAAAPVASAASNRYSRGGFTKHYSAAAAPKRNSITAVPNSVKGPEDVGDDTAVYLEERYGRNLPLTAARFAKKALQRRLAGVLLCDSAPDCQEDAGNEDLVVGPSTRGVKDVSENDVYLYPTGMSAIWSAHQLALNTLTPAKSICFGFPYTDTLKILEKWGPGCHFLGNGLDSDIDELEEILEREPILALFTEFPSNPLLRSADLPRLRRLADKYNFIIVVDETIGNLKNVKVIQYADIAVSSLSKVFSGASNVMGGRCVVTMSPLKSKLDETFEDVYFDEDAIYMERNSRDFKERVDLIDANTQTICEFLRSRSQAGGRPDGVIKEVWYPKYTTPEHYEHCRIKSAVSEDGKPGGYGGLFSLTFTSMEASKAFFDTLNCYKGPSLGTNFTLACPFTILAHFLELDWAARYGVEEGLVRVSVGLEDKEVLLESFRVAVEAAQNASVAKSA